MIQYSFYTSWNTAIHKPQYIFNAIYHKYQYQSLQDFLHLQHEWHHWGNLSERTTDTALRPPNAHGCAECSSAFHPRWWGASAAPLRNDSHAAALWRPAWLRRLCRWQKTPTAAASVIAWRHQKWFNVSVWLLFKCPFCQVSSVQRLTHIDKFWNGRGKALTKKWWNQGTT